jgi:hypothetical protein
LHQTNCDSVDIMMIVSLTRGGLRDESHMADEAFALSPISARASLPGEEDYEAISHAFMETSRGRWFLGEYAKRNRNADTRMVLDAVARIEQTVTAQKQAAEQAAAETRLTEALAAIRRAVYEAQAAAAAAVQNLGLDDNLAPVRKGSRIIKEISWRWREIGADSRICDLLDSQVAAIDEACEKIGSASPAAALIAAFDLIKARIAGLDDGDRDAPSPEAAAPSSSAAAPDAIDFKAVEAAQETSAADNVAAASHKPAEAVVETAETVEAPAAVIETREQAADATAEVADITAEIADVAPEAAHESPEAADAYDEALLDMVALEMAAPEPDDFDDAPSAMGDEIEEMVSPPPAPILAVAKPEPAAAPKPLAAPEPPAAQALLQPSLEPAPKPVVEPSLGSSLLARGLLHKPKHAVSDPLAPIRRMSQAEKVALFS